MKEKRYAIVRVNKDYYLNSCPAGFENINNDFVCNYKKDNILNQYVPNCKKCRYGDTKEQLVRKVAQVIKRKSLKGAIWESDLAKEIVEFLGVSE